MQNPFLNFGYKVPQKYIFPLPDDCNSNNEFSFIIPAQINWIREIIAEKKLPSTFPTHQHLSEDEIYAFLSQGNSKNLGTSWIFIHLTYLKTSSEIKTFKNLRIPLLKTHQFPKTYQQLIDFIGELSFNTVWENPYIHLIGNKNEEESLSKESVISIKESTYASKLLELLIAKEKEGGSGDGEEKEKNEKSSNSSTSTSSTTNSYSISNLGKALAIIREKENFLIFRPFLSHNLQDLTNFSPYKLSSSNTGQLFIIYQILKFLRDFELSGLPTGDLSLSDFYTSEGLYISVYPKISNILNQLEAPIIQPESCDEKIKKLLGSVVSKVRGWSNQQIKLDVEIIEQIIMYWIEGFISNYEYLLFLNYLVGRFSNGNPNYHPVFPWVTDFSEKGGGWRDLTKSKFRINKGERQLDLTFEESKLVTSGSKSAPHHVTDVLSEITYFVYKARRTPKEVLCKFVRPKWVPAEYPVSIQRMQEWSPEELIPEFYDDPSIFKSIHSDLPDLQIPEYSNTPEDFIKQHRKALESEHVSSKLHHWIDLTFGYKLSGNAAIKAKNVYLSQVDCHLTLEKNGIVQLFLTPHPPKKSTLRNKKNIVTFRELKELRETDKLENESPQYITLPKHYDPQLFLTDFEVYFNFFHTHFPSKKGEKGLKRGEREISLKRVKRRPIISLQTKQLACLIIELVQNYRIRHVAKIKTIPERFEIYRKLINVHELPLFIIRTLQAICFPEKLEFSIPIEITTSFLFLGKKISPIPFPDYFEPICKIVNTLKSLDLILQNMSSADVEVVKSTRLHMNELKVKSFSRDLIQILANEQIDQEGLEIIIPFVLELFFNSETRVLAVWNLFCPLAKALGRKKTVSYFLQPIVQIYESDYISDKHLKLFHRSFFLQLMSCFGLEIFLDNFSTLIIEAIANWPKTIEALEQEEFVQNQNQNFNQNQNQSVLIKGPPVRTHLKSSSLSEVDMVSQIKLDPNRLKQFTNNNNKAELEASESNPLPPEPEMFVLEPDQNESDNESNSSQGLSAGSAGLEQDFQRAGSVSIETEENEMAEATRRLDYTLKMKSTSNDISEMCCESLVWLSHRYGPVLTAKFLTRNLLRMLTICYSGNLDIHFEEVKLNSSAVLQCDGDSCSERIFECLLVISDLYGEAFIERQYFPYCIDIINSAFIRMSFTLEAALLGVCSLVERIIRHLSDSLLVSLLKDVIIKSILKPIVNAICSSKFIFPSGSNPRTLMASKVIGMIKNIKKKIGPDLSNLTLKPLIDQICLFLMDYYNNSSKEEEAKLLFGPNNFLPLQAYSAFCDIIIGTNYEEILRCFFMKQENENLQVVNLEGITNPISTKTTEKSQLEIKQKSSFGSRSLGNRIHIQETTEEFSTENFQKSIDKTRHLRGNWLLYWEHEVGRFENNFNFKQIKLQTFTGHSGAIRAIHCLNNENSFLTASKDRTVKVYSLRNQGDENTVIGANWTYNQHKKPVLSVIFNESFHLAASTDGFIHIWDPFIGKVIRIIEKSTKPICSLKSIHNSSSFIGASIDGSVHIIDFRTCRPFEMKIGIGQNVGLVRCMALSNSGQNVTVGHSSGMLSALDIRNGTLLGSWKAHEGEILKLISYKDRYVISSSFDQAISVWNLDENKLAFHLRGATEPVHSLLLYNTNLISCTTSNRIGVHMDIDQNSDFSSTRLRSDSFKGIVTTMSILPLNQLILVGSDSGNISLLS